MSKSYLLVNVEDVRFDSDNPRVKMALSKYNGLDDRRIQFALRDAGTTPAGSYASLRDSIRVAKGVTVPITVVREEDGYMCIDGNTRLAVYKEFNATQVAGDWTKIKAIVYDSPDQLEIERIRVSAHLVGARDWPAYEKARYLHYLRNQQLMGCGEMIQLCGGNRGSIERQIDAYHDMNEYYRDVVDDAAFRIDLFNGFVELQKRGIKKTVYEAGFDLTNFGQWITDGMIYRLADVRHLPKVLHDPEAKELFLAGGTRSIEKAIARLAERNGGNVAQDESKITLQSASLYQLAESVTSRIEQLPFTEFRTLKAREGQETVEALATLASLQSRLDDLLEDVGE